MSARALWRDVVAGRVQLALIPLAPILLLPFIIVAFVVLFPLWVVSLAVLSVVRGLAWLADRALGAPRLKPSADHAFQWVLTFGGLTRKLERR
ncbi:MAG TPA: hypothetical protein VHM30_15345 [Gemmatimonadaceae bacterium]|nr:hypothetical protein [Gemmatimonadaceae bacterium]